MRYKKKVCVIGLGYIGLPTSALLANSGYYVAGVDVKDSTINTVNHGKVHIVEPGLEGLVSDAVTAGNLKAFYTPQPSDVYIICVPTPFHDNGATPKPDISYVLDATKTIAPLVKANDLIILESTSPVGTTELVAKELSKNGVDISQIFISYCPERVLPGNIVIELRNNDRIVGGINEKSTKAAANFYREFVHGNVLETNSRTAEMCKLTENSFRDVNIAFANELSLICAQEGIDTWELVRLANHHPRVNILQPGIGVGGHCIAVDPWFIIHRRPDYSNLIRAAREVNLQKTQWVINQIKIKVADFNAAGVSRPKIACLGLTFKPDVDDLRESPALEIANTLSEQGYNLFAVDPNVKQHDVSFELTEIQYAVDEADIIVALVRHKAFTAPDVQQKLQQCVIVDFCELT